MEVGYGFSEVFGPLTLTNSKVKSLKNSLAINVGFPLPGYKVGIFDKDGNELPYGKGHRGELWVKSDANMHGYYNKEEITNKTIIDGWLHSGDLCEIDKEGNVYCYGRLKNTIDVSNKKVYLFDISNDIRSTFNLHDIFVENKNLSDGSIALNMYFVQKEDSRIDSRELIEKINNYLAIKNIKINGYKEFYDSLPIDPTTLKQKNKDIDGFINYDGDDLYEISYDEIELDIYSETGVKILHKQ